MSDQAVARRAPVGPPGKPLVPVVVAAPYPLVVDETRPVVAAPYPRVADATHPVVVAHYPAAAEVQPVAVVAHPSVVHPEAVVAVLEVVAVAAMVAVAVAAMVVVAGPTISTSNSNKLQNTSCSDGGFNNASIRDEYLPCNDNRLRHTVL